MNQSILIIDDSSVIHDLVRASLVDEDVSIRSAFSGEEGLAMAMTSCPDLVLLDVNMPSMDGFEVCRHLRDDLRSIGAEVIFLSGMASPEEKVMGLDLGATDYIAKPFDPDEFCARVRRALKNKARLDATRSRRVDDFISRALGERAVTA